MVDSGYNFASGVGCLIPSYYSTSGATNGTEILLDYAAYGGLTISKVGGGTFTLAQLDSGQYYNLGTTLVTVEGSNGVVDTMDLGKKILAVLIQR